LFDSVKTTTDTNTGTLAPNAPGGSILGAGGSGNSASIGYSPGNVQGQGSINVSSGGILDQGITFSTAQTDNSQYYSNQTAPTVNVDSAGASGSSSAAGGASGSSLLGISWYGWGLIAIGAIGIIWILRHKKA